MVTVNCLHILHTGCKCREKRTPHSPGCALDRGKRVLQTIHPLLIEADVQELDLVQSKDILTNCFSLDFVSLKGSDQDHTVYFWVNIMMDLIF